MGKQNGSQNPLTRTRIGSWRWNQQSGNLYESDLGHLYMCFAWVAWCFWGLLSGIRRSLWLLCLILGHLSSYHIASSSLNRRGYALPYSNIYAIFCCYSFEVCPFWREMEEEDWIWGRIDGGEAYIKEEGSETSWIHEKRIFISKKLTKRKTSKRALVKHVGLFQGKENVYLWLERVKTCAVIKSKKIKLGLLYGFTI